ncbi:MAG: TRAP transporter small permease [Desulfovibrio sp.]|nr:MAG: TRAP transporter small permease [Desulfovibrio sp.]
MDTTLFPQEEARGWLATFDKYLVFALRTICVICFTVLLLLLTGNVFVRFFPVAAFFWFDEIVEWSFAWMIFFGAAALWARDDHFRLEWIHDRLKGSATGHIMTAAVEILALAFIVVFFYQAFRLTYLAKDWTPVFNVSRRFLYVCMPLSGLIMVGYSVRNVIRDISAFVRLRKEKE